MARQGPAEGPQLTRAQDRQLEALEAVREEPRSEAGLVGIAEALRSRHAIVLTEAAKIAGRALVVEAAESLVAAFERLLDDPKAQDPGCLAKGAIAHALLRMEESATGQLPADVVHRVFSRGARHVQLDPVWGGRADVAGDLRVACAAGLMTRGDVTALEVLADHLADPEGPVRKAAALNLAARGDISAALLLRLRARLGDEEPAIHGETLRALLQLDADATDVAAAWLGHEDEAVQGEAAFALGASRTPAALSALRRAYEDTFDAARRRVLLTAIAMVRTEDALACLLDVVLEAATATAVEAIEALGAYAGDPGVQKRVDAAVEERGEDDLRRAVEETFGPS